jgi:hypothetical protein
MGEEIGGGRPLCYCTACKAFVPWDDCKAIMFDPYHMKDGKVCGSIKYIPREAAELIRKEAGNG